MRYWKHLDSHQMFCCPRWYSQKSLNPSAVWTALWASYWLPYCLGWRNVQNSPLDLSLMSPSSTATSIFMNLDISRCSMDIGQQIQTDAHKNLLPYFPTHLLQVQVLNGTALVMGTSFYCWKRPNTYFHLGSSAWYTLTRFLLLTAYDGVCINADMLVICSFQPLYSPDLWYQLTKQQLSSWQRNNISPNRFVWGFRQK